MFHLKSYYQDVNTNVVHTWHQKQELIEEHDDYDEDSFDVVLYAEEEFEKLQEE